MGLAVDPGIVGHEVHEPESEPGRLGIDARRHGRDHGENAEKNAAHLASSGFRGEREW